MTGDGPLLVMLTSALGTMAAVVVELSLAGLVSPVVELTVAVFVTEPVALPGTCTMTVNVALAPAAREAQVQVIVPVPPAAGLLQLTAGPVFCVSDTNVTFAGSVSESAALVAADAPLFVTAMVYVRSEPAFTEPAPLLLTARSVTPMTVVETCEVLLPLFVSKLPVLTLTLLTSTVPPGTVTGTLTVSVNVAVAALASGEANEHEALLSPAGAHAAVGPVFCTNETNVVCGGKLSKTSTLCAASGPLFMTVMV